MATSPFAQSRSSFNPSDYPHTYLASSGNKIVMVSVTVILGVIMLVAGFFLGFHDQNQHATQLLPLFVIFAVIMAALSVAVLATYRFKLVLQPDRIDYQGLFKSWSMNRDQISNWRLNKIKNTNYLELTSSEAAGGKRKCSLQFKPDAAFTAWFADLHNSDAEEFKLSEQEIEQNPDFGATPEERLDAASRARKNGTALTIASSVIGYWCMFYPYPEMLPVWLCVAMPWLAIMVCWKSKGLYTLGNVEKKSAKTNLFVMVMMGAMGLAFHSFIHRDVVSLTDLIAPGAVLAIVLAATIGLVNNWYSRSMKQVGPYLIFCAMYAFGAIAATNHLLDHSMRSEVPVRVMDKYQTHGKGAASYLTLSAWGPNAGNNDLKVDRDYYNRTAVGQTICVYLYQGAYRIHWFNLGDCSEINSPNAVMVDR